MKTNLLKTGATPDLCPPVTPIECGTEGEIFNSSTLSNSVRVCLAAGEVAQLTAFKLAAGNTIKVFIDAKGNGVECADCGPDDRVPLMDCDGCHQNQLNEFKRQTYVVGPNCFVFVSDAPVGEPFVTMTKVHLDQVPPEFICQEPCYPPVTATVSICPVPNCFAWRGKKYLNLADFVADVQTIVTGATYDAATCTFSAPAGSTFPDLTIVACVPCPPLTISAVASGQASAVVTITGGPATVSISGDCCAAQEGNGPFTFTGLTAGTRYIFTAVSKCGTPSSTECDGCEQSTATTELTTDACPAVTLTMAAAGTNAVTVTVNSGGAAWVEIGDAKQYVANGATATFSGLQPDTEYFAVATSDCGSSSTASVKTLPCPAVVLTQTANTPNSVTVSSNIAATVTLGAQEAVLAAGASHTFTELKELTNYTVKAVTECGAKTVFTAVTAACPAISLTQTANTTSSITVTLVTGGTASVFVGGEEAVLANGSSHTFTDLTAGKTYTAKVISECGNKATFTLNTAACPAVDFTATALSTTSIEVTAIAGAPLGVSVVSQGGAVLDSIDDLVSTVIFADLPEGAIVTVKAVNECGKKKQLNVNLPDPVANPCPSFSLADASPFFKGFAYVAGDLIDPAATVAYRGGFIYPTAGEGHTVKVTALDGVTVIGYAVNKSDCANPCCTPVFNRTSVDGTIIDDTTNNYYIEGEVNKCDGTPVLPDDRLFNKGSLKTCVNGQIVDLDCSMLVKTLQNGCEPECEITTFITGRNQFTGGGVCIEAVPTSFSGGVAIAAMRDFSNQKGSIVFTGANPPTHFPFSYTNNTGCPVVLEAKLTGHTNGDVLSGNYTLGAIYNIGTQLAVSPPNVFNNTTLGSVATGWMWDQFKVLGSTGTQGGSSAVYQTNTVSGAVWREIVQAGATVNLKAQAFLVFFEDDSPPNGVIVHTDMHLMITVTKGAAYL